MTGTAKRPHLDDQEEDVVDDLVVAAQFAVAQPVLAKPPSDRNEIDLEEDDEAASSSENDIPVAEDSLQQKEDEVNDEESDVEEDQTTHRLALEKLLVGLDSDGEEQNEDDDVGSTKPPQERKKALSKNEVDAYDATMNDLQKRLNWNLEIGNVQLPVGPSSWAVAGQVQHHVVSERTIVILSPVGGTLLEAGTLLALRLDGNAMINGQRLPRLVPLGRILEVFGPVSRPLYSLRLTCLEESTSTQANSSQSKQDLSNSDTLRDPWGKEGLFTAYVKQHSHLPVYFVFKGSDKTTRILDTAQIYKSSGRGCDASNLYDEEIDQNDMDYSDDEQERRAKQNRKGNRRQASRPGVSPAPTVIPIGFHHPGTAQSPQSNPFSRSVSGGMPATNTYDPSLGTPTPSTNNNLEESDTEYYDFS